MSKDKKEEIWLEMTFSDEDEIDTTGAPLYQQETEVDSGKEEMPESYDDVPDDKKLDADSKKQVTYAKTSAECIQARYKNGKLQAYDVTVYLGRVTEYDKKKDEYHEVNKRIKRSFKKFRDAVIFRDEVRGDRAAFLKKEQSVPTKLWTFEEVIPLYEEYMKEFMGKDDDYMKDMERYKKRVLKYFCKENDLDKVCKIEKGHIQDFLLHEKTEKDYSRQTLQKEKTYLSQMWKFMKNKSSQFLVYQNVTEEAIIPQEESNYKVRNLHYTEIEELIREACKLEDPTFLFIVVFSITQALRRGEICGMKWSDVDWEKRIVTIQHNRVQRATKDSLKLPKKGRIRIIELHDVGYDTIKLYKEWQEEYLGHEVNPDSFVLQYEVNLKYNYIPHTGKVSRKWKETYNKINKQRVKMELPEIPYGRIHDGRHVYASALLQGVKKDDGTLVHSAAYIQVYASMGHALPKALQNVTTQEYHHDNGERFEVTEFWNKLLDIDVADEWENNVLERQKVWESYSRIKQEKLKAQKQKRLEKAYREKCAGNPPEEELQEYSVDGELSSFEEDDL